MPEFDFAPRPPKQDDQDGKYSPFGPATPDKGKSDNDALSAGGPGAAKQSKGNGRSAMRRNPAESEGMLSGLVSMATTMGMARLTNGHVDPIGSPTGMLGMIKSAFGAKQEQADDHMFNLDLSRHGTAGGGLGGMSTGLGTVGGPVQAMAKRESTSSAMRAIGSMARTTGGGLSAMMGGAGGQARGHMHWLDKSVKQLYKVER